MKYSIRKKMFVISMVTTMISFLLILICFNIICSRYIEKESITELHSAVNMAEMAGIKSSSVLSAAPTLLATSTSLSVPKEQTIEATEILKSAEIADDIQREFIVSGNMVKLMIADKSETIYPVKMKKLVTSGGFLADEVTTAAVSAAAVATVAVDVDVATTVAADTINMEEFYNMGEVQALQSYLSQNHTTEAPTKISVNDISYYVISTPVIGDATAVFYKNIQPLEDLVRDVNTALLVLLIICGIITVAASMALSNGMVRSIRQLCGFAEAIGGGSFEQRTFRLKEHELAVLADDMNQMAKQLSEYDYEQKTFFQNVSHELRTPLMSIQGYAEGITAGVFKEEKTNDAANVILAESERLAEMVEDLLYLSRMDSSKANETQGSFDCVEAVSLAVDRSKVLALGKKIDFEVIDLDNSEGVGFIIGGSRREFEKAILNIVINGLRYALSNVTITCDCINRTVTIRDDGNGIHENDMPHIFKRFYKGKGGCIGIGLSISKAAIEKMGGSITVQNINDDLCESTGAVFTVKM